MNKILTHGALKLQAVLLRQQYNDAVVRGDLRSAAAAVRQMDRILDQWPK